MNCNHLQLKRPSCIKYEIRLQKKDCCSRHKSSSPDDRNEKWMYVWMNVSIDGRNVVRNDRWIDRIHARSSARSQIPILLAWWWPQDALWLLHFPFSIFPFNSYHRLPPFGNQVVTFIRGRLWWQSSWCQWGGRSIRRLQNMNSRE